MVPVRVIHAASGLPLAAHAFQTVTFFERLRGWLGKRSAREGEGLWFRRCASVHTFGMALPLDLVFLDRELKVVKLCCAVPPWRVAAAPGADSVLELPEGTVLKLAVSPGDQMQITRR